MDLGPHLLEPSDPPKEWVAHIYLEAQAAHPPCLHRQLIKPRASGLSTAQPSSVAVTLPKTGRQDTGVCEGTWQAAALSLPSGYLLVPVSPPGS